MKIHSSKLSSKGQVTTSKNPVKNLCGILKGKGADNVDLVQSLLDDRKKDLKLEKRGMKLQ